MNNNKEYGVELELKTNKFRNGLKGIAKVVQETTAKMKQDLSTGFNMDRGQAQSDIEKSMQMIEDYQNKIEEFQREFGNVTKAGTTPGGWTVSQKQLNQIDEYRSKIAGLNNSIKATQEDLRTLNTSPFARLGALAGSVRNGITSAWHSIRNFGKDGKRDVDGVNSELKETVTLSDRIGIGFTNLGHSIQTGFDRGLRSVKRFAFSLFGIHSIWRVVSRAASAYLAYDTELANKIEGNWVALGAMLEPILTWITDVIRQIVGYINVFVKAFTGKDLVSKANKKITSSTKETTKAVKELNKELTSLDEITNLTFDEQNNNIDDSVDIPENPLEGFDDIELNPEIVAFVEELAYKLKNLWEWIKKNKDLLMELGKIGLAAFTGWEIGKVVTKLSKLIGVEGGKAGLYGLITAFGVLDVYLAVTLYNDIVTLYDLLDQKQKGQQENYSYIEKTLARQLEILTDENAKQDDINRALGNLDAVYESYLTQLANGADYTKEQKDNIKNMVKKLEDISGRKFSTEIEAKMNIDPNTAGSTSAFTRFFNSVTRNIGGVFGTVLGGLGLKGLKFASGTVAYEPTFGQFGEYSGASTNPEIVSPQSIMEETLYTALARALPLVNSGGQQGDIVLEINGREFARATYDDFEYESNRLGKNTSIRRY